MSRLKKLRLRPRGHRRPKKLEEAEKHRRLTKPDVANGYFKSFDGTKLFYSMEGEGKPIIFCYGLVCSSLHWTYQIEHFRNKYQTIWFDYRAHHNSETPKDLKTLTIENTAKDLKCLMDELQIKEAVILGHSMGVNIALDFNRLYPEMSKGSVLISGTARRPFETLFHTHWFQNIFDFIGKTYEKSPTLMRKIWDLQKKNPLNEPLVTFGGFNPYLTPKEDIQLYLKLVLDFPIEVFLQVISTYRNYDASHWLDQMSTPTLVIGGDDDHMTPRAEQELLAQLIPGSELEILQYGSHCVQMDMPDMVNARIGKFLKRLAY